MASIINATTSSGLIVSPDQSGILQLQSAGNTIATISSTGIQTNVGAPAFYATYSGAFTVANNTQTKAPYSNSAGGFNVGGYYDYTTNYRFTPLVAGYYQVNFAVGFPITSSGYCSATLYKNGSSTTISGQSSYGNYPQPTASGIIYLNGSTDYLEVYTYHNNGNSLTTCYAQYFSAALIRSA